MNLSTLVSAQELAALLDSGEDLLVVDCRSDIADPARGAREHALAHIRGAVFADLNADLSDLHKTGLGRHPLPDATDFSRVLSRWGWTPDVAVVAYDEAGGALSAARLWWMLRLVGSTRAAVLDGGLKAWGDAGYPLSDVAPTRGACDVMVSFDPGQIVYTDELQRIRATSLLLDARAAPRYRGENETIDPVAGHVPGAANRPFATNLQADGRFKSAGALRAEFEALLGDSAPASVVHMCGSGVTACHNLLAMAHAGLGGSRVYAPSWSGWIADAARSVARGEERG